MNFYRTIIVTTITFISFCYLKDEDQKINSKPILCADTSGLRLEFLMPNFENINQDTDFSLKFYNINDRNSYDYLQGKIIKKKRQKNSSYSFYDAYFYLKKGTLSKVNFRFYPPSTLMVGSSQSSSETLACWREK